MAKKQKFQKRTKATNVPEFTENTRAMSELGHIGLKSHQGIIKEDFHRELNFPQASRTYKNMTYDSTISSAITMLKAIARGAKWEVLPSESGTDEAKIKHIQQCMDDMDKGWNSYVSEILGGILTYGYNLNEKVFKRRKGFTMKSRKKSSKYDDGRIGWATLPSRAHHSINRWLYKDRDLIGVQQNVGSNDDTINTGKAFINIPIQKLLHFRHNPEYDNPEGSSPLKNCFIPWTYKTSIEEYEAVGISRDLAGMPVKIIAA